MALAWIAGGVMCLAIQDWLACRRLDRDQRGRDEPPNAPEAGGAPPADGC